MSASGPEDLPDDTVVLGPDGRPPQEPDPPSNGPRLPRPRAWAALGVAVALLVVASVWRARGGDPPAAPRRSAAPNVAAPEFDPELPGRLILAVSNADPTTPGPDTPVTIWRYAPAAGRIDRGPVVPPLPGLGAALQRPLGLSVGPGGTPAAARIVVLGGVVPFDGTSFVYMLNASRPTLPTFAAALAPATDYTWTASGALVTIERENLSFRVTEIALATDVSVRRPVVQWRDPQERGLPIAARVGPHLLVARTGRVDGVVGGRLVPMLRGWTARSMSPGGEFLLAREPVADGAAYAMWGPGFEPRPLRLGLSELEVLAWAPEGSAFAASATSPEGRRGVYVVSLGEAPVLVADLGPGDDRDPPATFSGDGRVLFFMDGLQLAAFSIEDRSVQPIELAGALETAVPLAMAWMP
jgi:hypothetical protein